ncbi:MAG: glycosyltransferase family 4 protein [Erysipelotrichaceae bacterium]
MTKRTINMLSSADKVKGQGVGSAYIEQVALCKKNLTDQFIIKENEFEIANITHYHTVDLRHYLTIPFIKNKSVSVGYVHFLPETLDNSIKLPYIAKIVLYKYIISFYKNMDYLVTVNPYFIKRLESYGVNPDKVSYIPNYVSKKNFFIQKQDQINNTKQQYGLSPDDFIVLCVGQLQTRKGFFDFMEVAKNMPEIQFIWAGGFSFKQISDGYEQIKKAIENPPNNVKFLGIVERSEMNSIYNMCDIMFLASYEELFPMTILESSNCHKPILLRDIDLYKNILDGHYAKGNTVSEFCDQITKLKNDPQYYQEFSKLAKQVSEYYCEENVAKLWKEYYTKIDNKDNN